jgi:hypothetical protein
MTSYSNEDIDFIATNCALYAETISNSSTSYKGQQGGEEALLVKLVELISAGPIHKHQIPTKSTATTIISPWNQSGVHWVLVAANAASAQEKAVHIYDTFNSKSQRHSATWRQTQHLRLFLELLGLYHQTFRGTWPERISQGRTVRQHDDDCGAFTAWNAKALLFGGDIRADVTDASLLGTVLRTIYVGEIRGAIECSAINKWNRALESEYLAAINGDVGSDSDTDATDSGVRKANRRSSNTDAETDPELWLDDQDLIL